MARDIITSNYDDLYNMMYEPRLRELTIMYEQIKEEIASDLANLRNNHSELEEHHIICSDLWLSQLDDRYNARVLKLGEEMRDKAQILVQAIAGVKEKYIAGCNRIDNFDINSVVDPPAIRALMNGVVQTHITCADSNSMGSTPECVTMEQLVSDELPYNGENSLIGNMATDSVIIDRFLVDKFVREMCHTSAEAYITSECARNLYRCWVYTYSQRIATNDGLDQSLKEYILGKHGNMSIYAFSTMFNSITNIGRYKHSMVPEGVSIYRCHDGI